MSAHGGGRRPFWRCSGHLLTPLPESLGPLAATLQVGRKMLPNSAELAGRRCEKWAAKSSTYVRRLRLSLGENGLLVTHSSRLTAGGLPAPGGLSCCHLPLGVSRTTGCILRCLGAIGSRPHHSVARTNFLKLRATCAAPLFRANRQWADAFRFRIMLTYETGNRRTRGAVSPRRLSALAHR